MPKPIVVGHDPRARDRAPVDFAIAAAGFVEAPLIVVSAHAPGDAGQTVATSQVVEIPEGRAEGLGELRAELETAGLSLECRDVEGSSAARRVTAEARCPVLVLPRGVEALAA